MIIVMPMAGRGERFRQAGFTVPKPLILVDGVPMFVRATRSLPLELATKLIFAVLEEHVEQFSLDRIIREQFGQFPIEIVPLRQVTSGQAETVSLALEGQDLDQPLLVFNADSAFEDEELAAYILELEPDVDGFLQVFTDDSNRWSFVRCVKDHQVVETAEKRAISNQASTGLYHFSSARRFRELVRDHPPQEGEPFIAPLYNHLIAAGGRILAKPVGKYFCFGTPEDFKSYRTHRHAFTYVP